MVSLVNSHTNATSKRWHLWEMDKRFALNSSAGRCPGGFPAVFSASASATVELIPIWVRSRCSDARGLQLRYKWMGGGGSSFSMRTGFISHKVFLKLFCRIQFPRTSVDLSCAITNTKK